MLNSIYTDQEVLAKKKKTAKVNNIANLNSSDYVDPVIDKPTSVLPRPKINTEPDFIKPELTSPLYSDSNDIANQVKIDSAITENSPMADFDSESKLSKTALDETTKTASSNAGLIGGSGDYAGAATGALALAGGVMAREKSAPQSKKESTGSALALGAQGAALGATVGGPWGAAIGFVAGTGYGLIKGNSDAKKIVNRARKEQATYLSRTTQEREAAQRLADGKDQIEKSKNILQNQMGLIGSKYINNQNS